MKPDRLNELLRQGQSFDKTLLDLPGRPGAAEEDPWPAFAQQVGEWLLACVAHGKFLPTGSPDRRALQGQVDYWTTRLRQAGHPRDDIELLARFDPDAGEPLDDDAFPYFGLDAVTADRRLFNDAERTPRFLGREAQTREYTEHLSNPAHRALLIESESGGGKSSVAMAGVIPELKAKHGDQWLFAPRLTPGAQPMQALHEALAAALGPDLPGPAPSAEAVAAALGPRRLLLFVDQLEELLTVCVDANAQQQFSDWLAALAQAGPLRLLATMRSDHHDRLANSLPCRALYRLLTDHDSARLLPPLSFEQLRQVILRPAQAVGLRFVPATLVDRLANETANLPGGLPRLQFALKRLWALRPPRESDKAGQPKLDLIDQGAFDLLPSVSEALGKVAKELLAGLSADEKRAVQRLSLELTVLDERSEAPLRRRRLQEELLAVLDRAGLAAPANGLALIDSFVAAGLLVRTGTGASCQVEVAHESLFRHWDDFQGWIKTDQARGRLKQVRQIAQDAAEWESKGQHADYLRLAGEPLAQALVFASEGWLDETSQRYCRACRTARQKASWFKWGALVTLALAAVGTLGGFYVSQERRKESQRLQQESMRLQQESLRKLSAATTSAGLLLGRVEPLDALDLAFTLEKQARGKFITPLAHAVDRLEGSAMLGAPRQATDFSASGASLVQRVGQTKRDESAFIDFWPLRDDGSWWPKAVRLPVPPDSDSATAERLASIDVSPPLNSAGQPGAPDRRVALLTYFKPPPGGSGPNIFTRAALWELDSSASPATRELGEYQFEPKGQPKDAPGVQELSEAAFDRAGQVTLSAIRYTEAGPSSQVVVLKASNAGRAQPEDVKVTEGDPTENQRVVKAVARGTDGRLITGRFDGSIFCNEKRLERVDRSPIAALRVAGPWVVGLHSSGRLVAGNCDEPGSALISLHEGKTSATERIQSLALWGEGKRYQLSFVDGKQLCVLPWTAPSKPSAADMKACWVSGWEVDQAMPVLIKSPRDVRFLTLPDRRRPWLVPLAGEPLAPVRDVEAKPSDGLPVGRPADRSASEDAGVPKAGTPAAASTTAATSAPTVAGIDTSSGGSVVWRKSRGGTEKDPLKLGPVSPDFRPQAVTINDAGTTAVLGTNGQLVVVEAASDSAGRLVPVEFKPVCMALSPDGKRLVASGRQGGRMQLRLDDLKAQPEPKAGDNRAGDPLDACAVADNGVSVSGFQDGRIEVYDDAAGAPPGATAASGNAQGTVHPDLNPLVQFGLNAGIQSLSVNANGRFVAALGKPSLKSCGALVGGRPLRIWDRTLRPPIPVASTCLASKQVTAIGPVRQIAGRWQLEVFEVDAERQVKSSPFVCLACELTAVDLSKPGTSALSSRVNQFNPIALPVEDLKRRYGIEL